MNRVKWMVSIGVLAVAFACLQTLDHRDPNQRGLEFLPEMVYSQASESFSSSPVFEDGKTMQGLQAGVVPVHGEILHFPEGAEGQKLAGETLQLPPVEDPAKAAEFGRSLYGIYCATCHGISGDGDGAVVQRGMLPPPSLHAPRAVQLPDGSLYHVLSYGQGNMAPYRAQLDPAERWAVIRFLRELQASKAKTQEEPPEATQ